jgi:hypothetical protein
MKKYIVGFLVVMGVLAILAGAFIFYNIKYVDYQYTGEELFSAINSYHLSKGLQELTIEQKLCDNLVERYLAVKDPNGGHKRYAEWLKAEGIADDPKYGVIGELYVPASTPSNAVNWWANSPRHRTTLEMPDMKYGCSYANDRTV